MISSASAAMSRGAKRSRDTACIEADALPLLGGGWEIIRSFPFVTTDHTARAVVTTGSQGHAS